MVDARQLAQLTDVKFRVALAEMARLTAEEDRLRAALDEMDGAARNALTEASRIPGMSSLGADHLWRGWLISQRRELTMELARISARKADARARTLREGGRAQAADGLAKEADRDAARDRRRRQEQALQADIAMRLGGGRP